MHRVCNVEEAYQLALKAEEKQNQQFSQRNRGERRGTSSTPRGNFNFVKGELPQRADEIRQSNPDQLRGRGF